MIFTRGSASRFAAAVAVLVAVPVVSVARESAWDPDAPVTRSPMAASSRSQGAVHSPRQFGADRPVMLHDNKGRAMQQKRYPQTPGRAFEIFNFQMGSLLPYKYKKNTAGITPMRAGFILRRTPDTQYVSEIQKATLSRQGQPDYLRGPFLSSQGDSVTEWLYERTGKLYQWVDGELAFEGSVTDAERTLLVHGSPNEVIVEQLEPDIRRETWLYHSNWDFRGQQKVFSFSNGRMVMRQETP